MPYGCVEDVRDARDALYNSWSYIVGCTYVFFLLFSFFLFQMKCTASNNTYCNGQVTPYGSCGPVPVDRAEKRMRPGAVSAETSSKQSRSTMASGKPWTPVAHRSMAIVGYKRKYCCGMGESQRTM